MNVYIYIYKQLYMYIAIAVDTFQFHLVGGLDPSEKILVNWDDHSQNMGK